MQLHSLTKTKRFVCVQALINKLLLIASSLQENADSLRSMLKCSFLKVAFSAVDCTSNQEVCSDFDVKGYPTFYYLSYGKNPTKYEGGRQVSFVILIVHFTLSLTVV